MGAWIEIKTDESITYGGSLSHPTMGAWIEIFLPKKNPSAVGSHPTMGAWIEIH